MSEETTTKLSSTDRQDAKSTPPSGTTPPKTLLEEATEKLYPHKHVTRRNQTEAALRESVLRNKAILSAVPDLIFGYSREGEILYYNAPDASDLYQKPELFIGKRIDEILPYNIGTKFQDSIQKTLKTGQMQQFEYSLTMAKGIQNFEARMVVSEPDQVLAIVRNITEKKRAEAAERESEQRFKSITENALDCIYIKDIARRYTFVNPAFINMLRLPEEDILGKTQDEISGRDQARIIKEGDDRTFSGETVDKTSILTIDGEEYIFHTVLTPLTIKDGEVTSIMAVSRDVTERKRAVERALHDGVGQQLTGMRFLLGGLRRKLAATNPEAAERMAQIEQIAADTLQAVRQITTGLDLERFSEQPGELIAALQELASRVTDQHDIPCRIISSKPVLVQNRDTASHIFLIAQEAVTNAAKHANPSKIDISLSERNGMLSLSVKDNGLGYFPETPNKGMGMKIMRSRAKLFGASFDVQAGKSGGTVVTCTWKMPPEA